MRAIKALSGRWIIAATAWLFLTIAALNPAPARADYLIGFWAHDQDRDFPHAFFTVKGRPDKGGAEIDTNFGFTAVSVTPAILFGSVAGEIETLEPEYIRRSHRMFVLRVNDAGYAAIMATVGRWRAPPGSRYNLGKHNCVHFIGEVAQAVGLRVVFEKALMKKPRAFLENVLRLNPQLGASS